LNVSKTPDKSYLEQEGMVACNPRDLEAASRKVQKVLGRHAQDGKKEIDNGFAGSNR
jgi:hypothetical protein